MFIKTQFSGIQRHIRKVQNVCHCACQVGEGKACAEALLGCWLLTVATASGPPNLQGSRNHNVNLQKWNEPREIK